MGDKTGIEWTDASWNPVVGCQIVSPGCCNCYAMKMAARIEASSALTGKQTHYRGLTQPSKVGAVWTGVMREAPEAILTQPLRWRRPRRIFVNSMSDLFAEGVSDDTIARVFAIMALCPQHTFQVLTKRADRMLTWFKRYARVVSPGFGERVYQLGHQVPGVDYDTPRYYACCAAATRSWPLPNVWLGVSAEDQTRADERIRDLRATPAAVRFVSAEPLLGSIQTDWRGIDWVIVGGESGPGARPCWTPHVRKVVKQCAKAGVAVFVKQLGANVQDRNDAGFEGLDPAEWPDIDPDDIEHDVDGYRADYQGAPVRIRLRSRKGGDPSEWPEDLRFRQMPTLRNPVGAPAPFSQDTAA